MFANEKIWPMKSWTDGMSCVKNSANTTSDARAQTSRITASTSANIPIALLLGAHASSVGASQGGSPRSRRRDSA